MTILAGRQAEVRGRAADLAQESEGVSRDLVPPRLWYLEQETAFTVCGAPNIHSD